MANYVYFSDTLRASDNIGLDEFFLDTVKPGDLILYFYVNGNAVIIGKNQNPWKECDLAAMERDGVELTRRVSGGGAVYHDGGNLNYSFIAGEGRYEPELFQDLILSAVRGFGISCEASGRNDLLVDGRKISGTAVAVRHEARIHHGTLLIRADLEKLSGYLTVDPRKIRSKGISSVRSRVMNLTELCPSLTVDRARDAIYSAYKARFPDAIPLTKDALDPEKTAPYLARHATWEWRLGETPKFDLKWDERFSWGGVELYLSLEKSTIREVRAFSDAMDASLCAALEEALAGVALRRDAVLKAAQALSKEGKETLTAFAATV
ncbi:MAG: lipoate--protein ligase [Clostridia bacterium]|nr:lipoate--protein ligase [Clostridia bacterium]